MERALPYRLGSGRRNLFAARAWPGLSGAGRREIAGVALVIVAVIVTFTGDSNPAR